MKVYVSSPVAGRGANLGKARMGSYLKMVTKVPILSDELEDLLVGD